MSSYLRTIYCFPEVKPNTSTLSPIKVESPFKNVSKSFNIKTSYAHSFSPSPQKHFQNTDQQILNAPMNLLNELKIQSIDFTNKFRKLKPQTIKNLFKENITWRSGLIFKLESPEGIYQFKCYDLTILLSKTNKNVFLTLKFGNFL